MNKLTYREIKDNTAVNTYIELADKALAVLGYTIHSASHTEKVGQNAAMILTNLNYPPREIELARIAGYIHDIGNIAGRHYHAQSGAAMAFTLLEKLNMDASEVAIITSAIGNHDGDHGIAVNPVSAAIIIADKTDVRRSRVRNKDIASLDVHDRVNYSVVHSDLEMKEGVIKFIVTIDVNICSIMDYFDLFLSRMTMCKNASKFLGVQFSIEANGTKIL